MTTYQSNSNASMAFKVQSALGTPSTGAGGTLFRQTGGSGLVKSRAQTASEEARRDGMSMRGRLGTCKVNGQWTGEASLGSFEAILQAIMRDTWDAAVLSKTEADFTSLAIASNVITLGSGDPRTLGFRVGDVIRLTLMSTAANNNKNLRITGLTATTITIAANDVLVDQGADTACTITRPKKLWMQGSPLKRYFSIDEYDGDIDVSEFAQDFMFGMMKFGMAPNGLLMLDISGVGTGYLEPMATGSSPVLTSPTETSTIPLSVVDATIRVNGEDVVDLTNLDVTLDIRPSAPDVFGSGAIKYAPDVFPGSMEVGINFTSLRKDLTRLNDFGLETQYSLDILAAEGTDSEPKDFFNLHVGNFTLGAVQKSAINKAGGARTQTISIPPALVGKDVGGTGFTPTMAGFQSTGV